MAVRFKLDENFPKDAGALLRDAGHDVETVLDERLGGNPDAKVLDACQTENRVLITLDLDFSDIRLYPLIQPYRNLDPPFAYAKCREHARTVAGCPCATAERAGASSAMDC